MNSSAGKVMSGLVRTAVLVCIALQSATMIVGLGLSNEVFHKETHHHRQHQAKGPVTWYRNCTETTTVGKLSTVTLTNCASSSDCSLSVGEPLRLVVEFIAGVKHDDLSYEVVLENVDYNIQRILASGSGLKSIVPGTEYSIGINFILPTDLPPSGTYQLRVRRFDNGTSVTEVCAAFDLTYVDNPDYTSPLPTTTEPATTTEELSTTTEELTTTKNTTTPRPTEPVTTDAPTDGPTRTTGRPIYDCTVPGVFPDPHSCIHYHVCQLYPNGTIWDTEMTCALNTVFCVDTELCEFEPDCPCSLSFFTY